MRSSRFIVLFIAALLLIAGSYGFAAWRSAQTQPAAAQETVPLARSTAAQEKTTDELIAFWQARYERDPRDYISLTHLAGAHISKARETGSVDGYQSADAALAQALTLNPDYTLALAYQSAVRMAQHRFSDALALAERVYNSDNRAVQALAIMGDAQLELGQYDAAAAAYDTLQSKIDGPAVLGRQARLQWIMGDADGAIATMAAAAAAADDAQLSGESAAWYHARLGELYFHTGQLKEAAVAYETARAHFDPYYLALAGLGNVAAAEGDLETAVAYYEQVVTLTPQPLFLAQLGTLYQALGNDAAAQQQFDTIDVITALEAQAGVLINRQVALIDANQDRQLARALEMAQHDIAARADVYGYDVLAWTLYKNGRYEAAAAAVEQALMYNTPEAMFHYHAGMIYTALDQPQQAVHHLQTALTLNPYFDVQQAPIAAQTLDQLNARTN